MRALLVPLLLGTAACAVQEMSAPSLAPRAAETIDPRVPVPDSELTARADPQLQQQLRALVAQAVSADESFQPAIAEARRLAEAAGPAESESWVLAQQALSKAISARAPVTQAVGEIDALGARSVVAHGGIGAANLKAIESAAAQVAEIDNRQAAALASVQALLSR
jgi:hypothetical protein